MEALGFGVVQTNREREELASPSFSEMMCFLWPETTNEELLMAAFLNQAVESRMHRDTFCLWLCLVFNELRESCVYLFI